MTNEEFEDMASCEAPTSSSLIEYTRNLRALVSGCLSQIRHSEDCHQEEWDSYNSGKPYRRHERPACNCHVGKLRDLLGIAPEPVYEKNSCRCYGCEVCDGPHPESEDIKTFFHLCEACYRRALDDWDIPDDDWDVDES